MKTTITLAGNLHISPFEILTQDTDDVITLINYYLILAGETENEESEPITEKAADKSFWSSF